MKRYTEAQAKWIKDNAGAKTWENFHAFADAFNSEFQDTRTVDSLQSYMLRRDIKFVTKNRLTKEQSEWIKDNAQVIQWKSMKHFTDTFNALFGTDKSVKIMVSYLSRNGIQVRTKTKTSSYTDEMDDWLVKNFDRYGCDFVKLAEDFNARFKTDYSSCRIAKHCQRGLKIHTPKEKSKAKNKGQFQPGKTNKRGLPVGTIRYNSDNRPFIKVLESDGQSGMLSGKGHNYKEPWWMPLQKKIWQDHFGEVPEGFEVVSLNGNPNDTGIKNIGLIDRRGKAVMAKKGWWSENSVITGNGVRWCNLYYTAKDNDVL